MIGFPSGVRVWLATGHTDMRKGFPDLALLVQEKLETDPHSRGLPDRVRLPCGLGRMLTAHPSGVELDRRTEVWQLGPQEETA